MAASGGKRIVTLPISVQGELAEHERAEIDARIREALGRGGVELVEPIDDANASACVGADCVKAMAIAADATHVLRTIINVDGRDYEIELLVSDGASGLVVASAADSCDTCGLAEVVTVATDVATAVRRKLDAEVTTPPVLIVRSKPAGALVKLDGEPIGTTPLEATVPAGEHDLTVEKQGFIVVRQRTAFVDGVRESVRVNLQATGGSAPGGPSRSNAGKTLRIAGWSTAGLGLAALGAGIALIAIDDRPITSECGGENVDLDGDCKYRYGTLLGGALTAGAGAAALVTGIALAAVGHRRGRKASTARLRARPGGLALRF